MEQQAFAVQYQLPGQPEAINIHPHLYSTYKVSQHKVRPQNKNTQQTTHSQS